MLTAAAELNDLCLSVNPFPYLSVRDSGTPARAQGVAALHDRLLSTRPSYIKEYLDKIQEFSE